MTSQELAKSKAIIGSNVATGARTRGTAGPRSRVERTRRVSSGSRVLPARESSTSSGSKPSGGTASPGFGAGLPNLTSNTQLSTEANSNSTYRATVPDGGSFPTQRNTILSGNSTCCSRGRPKEIDPNKSGSTSSSTRSKRSRDRSRDAKRGSSAPLIGSTADCTSQWKVESKLEEPPATPLGPDNVRTNCPADRKKPSSPAQSINVKTQKIKTSDTARKRKTITNSTTTQFPNPIRSPTGTQLPKQIPSPATLTRCNIPPTKKLKTSCPTNTQQASFAMNPPALDLHAILRPFRNEIIASMELLHSETTEKLSIKIDRLAAENEQLRGIINHLCSKLSTGPINTTNFPTLTKQRPYISNTQA